MALKIVLHEKEKKLFSKFEWLTPQYYNLSTVLNAPLKLFITCAIQKDDKFTYWLLPSIRNLKSKIGKM